jgi:hypothetical protein
MAGMDDNPFKSPSSNEPVPPGEMRSKLKAVLIWIAPWIVPIGVGVLACWSVKTWSGRLLLAAKLAVWTAAVMWGCLFVVRLIRRVKKSP